MKKRHYLSEIHIVFDILRFRYVGIIYGFSRGDGIILEYKKTKGLWIMYATERNEVLPEPYQEFDNESDACDAYINELRYLKIIK